jgi:oligoendopeptidase F
VVETGIPSWNLAPLYPMGAKDPGIDTDLRAALDEAGPIELRLREAIAKGDPFGLAGAMSDLEACRERLHRASTFAFLNWCENVRDPRGAALLRRSEEAEGTVIGMLTGFEADWCRLAVSEAAPLLDHPVIQPWRSVLSSLRDFARHLLPDRDEQTLAAVAAAAGPPAWLRLFGQLTAGVQVDTEEGKLGIPQARARLRHPEPQIRRATATALSDALAPHAPTFATILGSIASHRAVEDQLRGYRSWDDHRHVENHVRAEEVGALETAVSGGIKTLHRWYATRARLLGLEQTGLDESSLQAPLGTHPGFIGWSDARALVVDAYSTFSPQTGKVVSGFFDGFVDAAPRMGRHVGAFAHEAVPGVHPYVFVTFTGALVDVVTLAHELGHGVHQALAAERGYLGSVVPPPVAEVASTFGEILVCSQLLEGETDPNIRLALLGFQIDTLIDSVFRPILYREFERRIHLSHREGAELSSDFIGDTWMLIHRQWFGDAVQLTEAFEPWWTLVRAFIRSPGNTYAYAYGSLAALKLFERWQSLGPPVVDAFLGLLRAGGTDVPGELLRKVGVDTSDSAVWNDGLSVIAQRVSEAEAVAAHARLDIAKTG